MALDSLMCATLYSFSGDFPDYTCSLWGNGHNSMLYNTTLKAAIKLHPQTTRKEVASSLHSHEDRSEVTFSDQLLSGLWATSQTSNYNRAIRYKNLNNITSTNIHVGTYLLSTYVSLSTIHCPRRKK